MDKQISEALIEKVLDHQPQAVNELIAQLQTSIFNLALRMLGNIADAEDATQEILFSYWKSCRLSAARAR